MKKKTTKKAPKVATETAAQRAARSFQEGRAHGLQTAHAIVASILGHESLHRTSRVGRENARFVLGQCSEAIRGALNLDTDDIHPF